MRDWTYRHYVANSLRLIPEGKALVCTLAESLDEAFTPRSIDSRSGDEIVEDIMNRAGLKWSE